MKYFDSMYGEFQLPDDVTPLVETSIIHRLRWIALSNIPSLSYPMISGVSRFSHSIGVAYLGSILSNQLGYSRTKRNTLLCSALLHDAGMPPLGHLTEEALTLLNIKFDHEESLGIILLMEGNRFALMPDGEKVGVTEALNKAKVNSSEVFDAISGKGELGNIVSSSIDIDNIDNVARNYRLIFQTDEGYSPERIAIDYFSSGGKSGEAYQNWSTIRSKLYQKLMFSIEDFAQKCTMKRLIKNYFVHHLDNKIKQDVIDEVRFLNDAQFLNLVLNVPPNLGTRFYSGQFDRVVTYGWIEDFSERTVKMANSYFVNTDKDYYYDYIPDKRKKQKSPTSKRGGFLGVFCSGPINKKVESNISEELVDAIPSFKKSVIPVDEMGANQTSLF